MLPPSVRIFVCTEPQDMRQSFDALALKVEKILGQDPLSGALYVFVDKRAIRAKVLWWDRNGYCILYKRLHRSFFSMPKGPAGEPVLQIDAAALGELLAGVSKEQQQRIVH
jgi:transposase